ncbi:MAG: metallo-mystery pair system four-Cys motif protein [Thermoleophilia bacterium]
MGSVRFRALALAVAATASFGASAAVAAPARAKQAKPATQVVRITFQAVSGTTPVTCGSPITGLGTTSATAQLRDLRFYISNVRMMRANGTTAPLKLLKNDTYNHTQGGNRTTLIDLENATGMCQGDAGTNSVIVGRVKRGTYVGARMYMGVPHPLNHTDTVTAPAPLNLASMTWSWQTGRKFAKIEVTDPDGATGSWPMKTFNVHLGSTGCFGNPAGGDTVNCMNSNRMSIMLRRFNPARQKVLVDLQQLLRGNDITQNRAGASGCMSGPTDPECEAVFEAMDINWLTSGLGTGTSGLGVQQTVFRAAAK